MMVLPIRDHTLALHAHLLFWLSHKSPSDYAGVFVPSPSPPSPVPRSSRCSGWFGRRN